MGERKVVYWLSDVPSECQITGLKITDQFIDVNTGMGWGLVHPKALEIYGFRLGVGRGQRYAKQADGKWLKIEG